MLKQCDMEKYIPSYIKNKLSPLKKHVLESHFEECEHCYKKLLKIEDDDLEISNIISSFEFIFKYINCLR